MIWAIIGAILGVLTLIGVYGGAVQVDRRVRSSGPVGRFLSDLVVGPDESGSVRPSPIAGLLPYAVLGGGVLLAVNLLRRR